MSIIQWDSKGTPPRVFSQEIPSLLKEFRMPRSALRRFSRKTTKALWLNGISIAAASNLSFCTGIVALYQTHTGVIQVLLFPLPSMKPRGGAATLARHDSKPAPQEPCTSICSTILHGSQGRSARGPASTSHPGAMRAKCSPLPRLVPTGISWWATRGRG